MKKLLLASLCLAVGLARVPAMAAEETGRRDQKCVLPGGRRIEKWPSQNRIAVRTGPEIGRCVP